MSMYMGWGRGKKEEGKERHLHNITVISQLSSNPFKFMSQLSSHKIMKKSGFNFFSNLLVFTHTTTSNMTTCHKKW